MKTKTEDISTREVMQAVDALRQEVARLSERLAKLEQAPAAAPQPVSAAPQAEGLSEELVTVISAAVAAFLGVKPHIRQIRLVRSEAWAQRGRVTVQASHALTIQRG